MDFADPPGLTFPQTQVGVTSDAQSVTLENIGNAALSFPVPSRGNDPNTDNYFSLTRATTCPVVNSIATSPGTLSSQASCVLSVSFMPPSTGSISGSIVLTNNNLNAGSPGYATQTVALQGTGVDATQTVASTPNSITVGQTMLISAAVSDSTSGGTVPTGGVTFTDTVGGNSTTLNGGTAVQLSSGTATLSTSLNGVGTHTITASYLGVAESFAPSTGSVSPNVTAQADNLVFAAIPNQTYGNSPFRVTASSSSSGAVTYSVASGPATISGNTVFLTGIGIVQLSVSQAANGNYAAGSAIASFTVSPVAQAITFTVATHTYGAAPFTVAATSNSAGTFTYSVVSGPATVSGSTVTLIGTGSVTLSATQAADGNYTSGTQTATFTVTPVAPSVSFTISNKTYGSVPFTVTAKSNSSGAFTYTVVSGPATISGSTVTLTGTGSVTLSASQTANGNYTAGSQNASFMVAAPSFLITLVPATNNTLTINSNGQSIYKLAITPADETTPFAQEVDLTASGLPAGAKYNFSPAIIAAGSPATNSVLTITTANGRMHSQGAQLKTGYGIAALGLFLLPIATSCKVRRSARRLSILTLLFCMLSLGAVCGLTGCGSSGFAIRARQTFTAASGSASQSTQVTLVEQ